MKKDIDKTSNRLFILPKWAQNLIHSKNKDIEVLKRRNENLEKINSILQENEWFTIKAPYYVKENEYIHLWIFEKDNPTAICSLGSGDILFVGRKKKEKQQVYMPSLKKKE